MSRVGKQIMDDMQHNNVMLEEINRRVDALLDENARLQAALTEQKRITDSVITVDVAGLRKAWKEAEALAERRGEALLAQGERLSALIKRIDGKWTEWLKAIPCNADEENCTRCKLLNSFQVATG